MTPYPWDGPNAKVTKPAGWTLVTDGEQPLTSGNLANDELDNETFAKP